MLLETLVISGFGYATWSWMRNQDATTRPIVRYVVGGMVILALLLAFVLLRDIALRMATGEVLEQSASSQKSASLKSVQSETGITSTSPATSNDLEDVIAQVAGELNATMPQKITNNITAVGVIAQANTVVVDYKSSSSFADMNIDEFRDREKSRMTERMCNNPAFKATVENGAKWRAIYTDPDGRSFSVAVRSCP